MRSYRFGDGTAVVTGAASGIGEALAHGLARRGSALILLDRDAERLAAVATALRAEHPQLSVETTLVDLADRRATEQVAARLAGEHPEITLLINNAGVALGGSFEQLSLEDFDWLMDINFRAVVTLTSALLPVLRRHRGSHLACVSSVFGLVAPAGHSAYSSSKFAVRGFTESLRQELAGEVGVTCVHPGGVATRIAETARMGAGLSAAEGAAGRAAFARMLTIPPSAAAQAILTGVERRRPRVLIGWAARGPDLLARVAPSSYGIVLSALLRRSRGD